MNKTFYALEVYGKYLNVEGSHLCAIDRLGFSDNELIAVFPLCRHAAHLGCIENLKDLDSCPGCSNISDSQLKTIKIEHGYSAQRV